VPQALVKADGKAKIEGYFGELGFRLEDRGAGGAGIRQNP
jgi:hypothetical protein